MIKVPDSIKLKYLNFSLILMFALPLFPTNIKPYVIILFGVSVLVSNLGERFKFNYTRFFISSVIYILMVLSLLYSDNMEYGLTKLETMSSLFLFPLIFSIFPLSLIEKIKKNSNKYMLVYFFAVVSFNLMSFLYHVGHYKETIFIHYPTVNRIAQGPYSIHPIYLSTHICIAILFSFFIINNVKSNAKKVIFIVLDIMLLAFLFILLKKGPILVLGIVMLIFVILQRNKKLLVLGLFVILLNIVTIVSIPQYRVKFLELTKIENVKTGGVTSTNIRFTIYQYAISSILKSPIIGYGIGDYNDELLNSLKDKYPKLYENRYNAHNQYLSFTLALGVVGLLCFICFLFYNLVMAIRFDNQMLILLILFYGLIMTFENILEREDGVIYFSFFVGYFGLTSFYDYKMQLNK